MSKIFPTIVSFLLLIRLFYSLKDKTRKSLIKNAKPLKYPSPFYFIMVLIDFIFALRLIYLASFGKSLLIGTTILGALSYMCINLGVGTLLIALYDPWEKENKSTILPISAVFLIIGVITIIIFLTKTVSLLHILQVLQEFG